MTRDDVLDIALGTLVALIETMRQSYRAIYALGLQLNVSGNVFVICVGFAAAVWGFWLAGKPAEEQGYWDCSAAGR